MIKIMQVSDLHIVQDVFGNRLKKLIYDVAENEFAPLDPGNKLLVLTGDYHFWNESAYQKAEEFIRTLVGKMRIEMDSDVFIIPGNHDVLYSDDNKTASAQRNTVRAVGANVNMLQDENDDGDLQNLLSRFDKYSNFCYKLGIYRDASKPSTVHIRTWNDKLNIVHVNTCLCYDSKAKDPKTNQVLDTKTLSSLENVNRLPSIVLGHNSFFDLQDAIKRGCRLAFWDLDTRAYLCGDRHRFEDDPDQQSFRIQSGYGEGSRRKTIPNIVCCRSSVDVNDPYSDIGFYIHNWDEKTGIVNLERIEWNPRRGETEFRRSIDESVYKLDCLANSVHPTSSSIVNVQGKVFDRGDHIEQEQLDNIKGCIKDLLNWVSSLKCQWGAFNNSQARKNANTAEGLLAYKITGFDEQCRDAYQESLAYLLDQASANEKGWQSSTLNMETVQCTALALLLLALEKETPSDIVFSGEHAIDYAKIDRIAHTLWNSRNVSYGWGHYVEVSKDDDCNTVYTGWALLALSKYPTISSTSEYADFCQMFFNRCNEGTLGYFDSDDPKLTSTALFTCLFYLLPSTTQKKILKGFNLSSAVSFIYDQTVRYNNQIEAMAQDSEADTSIRTAPWNNITISAALSALSLAHACGDLADEEWGSLIRYVCEDILPILRKTKNGKVYQPHGLAIERNRYHTYPSFHLIWGLQMVINSMNTSVLSACFDECTDINSVLSHSLKAICAVTKTDYNQIALSVSKNKYDSALKICADNIADYKQWYRFVLMDGVMHDSFDNGETIVIDNVRERDNYFAAVSETVSEAIIPIIYKGNTIGIINSESEVPAYYKEEMVVELSKIAEAIAVALIRVGYKKSMPNNMISCYSNSGIK